MNKLFLCTIIIKIFMLVDYVLPNTLNKFRLLNSNIIKHTKNLTYLELKAFNT